MQDTVHRLFQSGFSHNVRKRIPLLFVFVQRVVFFLRNLSGVADDGCEIFAVRITAERFLLNINSFQLVQILHDRGSGFVADVGSQYGRDKFLETVETDRITHIHQLQHISRIQILYVNIISVSLIGT